MKPWVTLYEEKRNKWGSVNKAFRWSNGRSMPYPNHLKENIPKIYPNNCVVDQITAEYGRFDRYPTREEDALNIGIRFNVKPIIISLSTMFNL